MYLGLGSNLGNRELNLQQALERLTTQMTVDKISSFYQTEPIGYRNQPLFLNAVCKVTTLASPLELLAVIKAIESSMGRIPSFSNAPRIIDIDILLYGNSSIDTPQLTIPHYQMTKRAFVLVPLSELAPDIIHPVKQIAIRELMKTVDGLDGVQKWNGNANRHKRRKKNVRNIH
ncbi:MAG: 2-amino-4-hydroxy-6-hydroxymethyldihydropteridine diphosphokinase [Dehalococcoidia bacterium]|nr:2-amino-4-hydroxy-6-hydroxymethyldihydropteridine diphosphokinase [Dehalococcoidia bacterium]